MKKITAVFLVAALSFALLSSGAMAEKPLSVVTTIFPLYDWAREIVGDTGSADVTLLLDSGVDLHSFQPTAADILKIATCDVFIYVGGESDEWAEDAIQEAVNPNLIAVSLIEALGEDIKLEETVEGMEEDEDEEEDEVEADEHVWLSLKNAEKLVSLLSDALSEADPSRAEVYRANAAAYCEKLAALDAHYQEVIDAAAFKTLLFGDRFPFRYLVDDYGLAYYAAFSGCSAESEASFKTIVFLAGKVDELSLPAVLTLENPQTRIAETVVANTQAKDQKILSLNSMQGTTAKDVQAGATYLSIMESNLSILQEALN